MAKRSALPLALALLAVVAVAVGSRAWVGSRSGEAARPAAPEVARSSPTQADLTVPDAEAPVRSEAVVQQAPPPQPTPPTPKDPRFDNLRSSIQRYIKNQQEDRGLEVSGLLRSSSGAWNDVGRIVAGHVHVELVSVGGGAPATYEARLFRSDQASGEVAVGFAFRGVPQGTYQLCVSTTDNSRWTPAIQTVTPPVSSLEIWCEEETRASRLGFRVLDAATGAPIESYRAWSVRMDADAESGVHFHAGPLSLERPLETPFEWRLWADGYVPASGDQTAFVREADGRYVAEVLLKRGWGRRFVALGRDPTMRPLAGASIRLDGREVGRTAADGSLDVVLPEAPVEASASWGGLERAPEPIPPEGQAAGKAMVTVLVLRPPSGE
ncbi:MAG: hypothetical protein AAF682_02965 [Planctomycetota bacterium]